MKWQSFENKIKTALSGHRSEVDADAIWAAIEPAVDAINKRKKRRGIIWFALAGLLVAGSALGYFYLHSTGKQQVQMTQIPVAEQRQQTGDEEATAILNATTEKEATASHSEPTPTGENFSEAPVNQVLNKNNRQRVRDSGSIKNGNENPPVLIKDEKTAQPIADSKSELPVIAPKEHELKPQLPGFLPALPFSLFDVAGQVNLPKNTGYLPAEAPPSSHRNRYSFSAGLQGSYSFVDRKLEMSDSFSTGLLTLREKTERELEAIQFGLHLTLRHESGFGLTSGVNYTQINERFRFNSTVTTVDTVYGVKYLVINLESDTIPIYGNIPLVKKTTHHKEYYNKYRMIDIPVLASYRYQGRGFAAGAEAGVFVNMSLSTEGKFLQNDSEVTDIGKAGIFKSNIGLSYYFGLSAGYLLNENLEFHISPFMRYFPKSFTHGSYELTQRYTLYGVNLGAVYHFD